MDEEDEEEDEEEEEIIGEEREGESEGVKERAVFQIAQIGIILGLRRVVEYCDHGARRVEEM